jgi:hypothetical protein
MAVADMWQLNRATDKVPLMPRLQEGHLISSAHQRLFHDPISCWQPSVAFLHFRAFQL